MATNKNVECQNLDRTTERYPKRHKMIQCTQTVAQKSRVAYLTKTKYIAWFCNCCDCTDRAQNMRRPASPRKYTLGAPDFIEIGSRSAKLYPNAWAPSKRTVYIMFPIFGWSLASGRIMKQPILASLILSKSPSARTESVFQKKSELRAFLQAYSYDTAPLYTCKTAFSALQEDNLTSP